MDSRYERAGTISFRCAADLPASESARDCQPGGSATAACGTFDAPAAYTTLTGQGVKDWVAFGLGGTAPSPGPDPEANVACYRRMDVELAKCDQHTHWNTWLLSGRGSSSKWAEHPGLNCFTCLKNCRG